MDVTRVYDSVCENCNKSHILKYEIFDIKVPCTVCKEIMNNRLCFICAMQMARLKRCSKNECLVMHELIK